MIKLIHDFRNGKKAIRPCRPGDLVLTESGLWIVRDDNRLWWFRKED